METLIIQGTRKEFVRGCEIFRRTYRERSENGIEVGRKENHLPQQWGGNGGLLSGGAIALMGFSAAAISNERKSG